MKNRNITPHSSLITPADRQKAFGHKAGVDSVRAVVEAAREIQSARFEEEDGIHSNAMMSSRLLRQYCRPNEEGMNLLKIAMEKVGLSARAYDRILKVSRTIADLEGSENIETDHLSEAIQYRSLDRDGWGG